MPRHRVVKIGENTTFHCINVSKNSKPIQWTFNEHSLPQNAHVSIESPEILRISNVRNANKGYYECEGYTKEGYYFIARAPLIIRGTRIV